MKRFSFLLLLLLAGCADNSDPQLTHSTNSATVFIPGNFDYSSARITMVELNGEKYVVAETGHGSIAITPATKPAAEK